MEVGCCECWRVSRVAVAELVHLAEKLEKLEDDEMLEGEGSMEKNVKRWIPQCL